MTKGSCLIPESERSFRSLSAKDGQYTIVTGAFGVGASDATHFHGCLSNLASTLGTSIFIRAFQDLFATSAADVIELTPTDMAAFHSFDFQLKKWAGTCYSLSIADGPTTGANQLASAAVGCS